MSIRGVGLWRQRHAGTDGGCVHGFEQQELPFLFVPIPTQATRRRGAFREHLDQKIGNVAAGGLLGFFLEEIGPSIYNRAVADVQERMQQRVADLDIEIHEDEFQYWRKFERRSR